MRLYAIYSISDYSIATLFQGSIDSTKIAVKIKILEIFVSLLGSLS